MQSSTASADRRFGHVSLARVTQEQIVAAGTVPPFAGFGVFLDCTIGAAAHAGRRADVEPLTAVVRAEKQLTLK